MEENKQKKLFNDLLEKVKYKCDLTNDNKYCIILTKDKKQIKLYLNDILDKKDCIMRLYLNASYYAYDGEFESLQQEKKFEKQYEKIHKLFSDEEIAIIESMSYYRYYN